jgi:hypothetical protein
MAALSNDMCEGKNSLRAKHDEEHLRSRGEQARSASKSFPVLAKQTKSYRPRFKPNGAGAGSIKF